MSLLKRARRFVSEKNRTIAVVIFPLAALTVNPAAATAQTPLTSLDTGTCQASPLNLQGLAGSTSSGYCLDISQTGPDSGGLTGIKIYTEDSSFAPNPIIDTSDAVGTYGLSISAGGTTTGSTLSFSTSIPVSWDFNLQTSDKSNLSYSLSYELFGSPDNDVLATGTLGNFNVAPGNVSGSGFLTFSAPLAQLATGYTAAQSTNITSWNITLDVEAQAPNAGSTIALDVPTNSLDLAPPSAPEPASVFLFGSGIVGLIFARVRRSKA